MQIRVADFIARAALSPLAREADLPPWIWTSEAPAFIEAQIANLSDAYRIGGVCAVHSSAEVESGAQIKGPAIIGPNCFIAATALLRGGTWLEKDCIIGPGCELKSSYMFAGSKLAHLNFVGDSVIGADVNIEAGAIVANYRNERSNKRIRFRWNYEEIDTGVDKFGAILGDHTRIGANAVIAPGALLKPDTIVPRLGLIDQGLL